DKFKKSSTSKILKIFVDENILISDFDRNSNQIGGTLEVAHESLLGYLDLFGLNIEEIKKEMITKKWLEEATQRWVIFKKSNNLKQANDELLRGYRLLEVLDIREKNAFRKLGKLGDLTQEENDYIDESKNAIDAKKRRRAILTFTFLSLVSLSVGLSWLQHQQQQQTERYRLIRDAALNLTTPELVKSLAPRLPKYLEIADRDRQKGNIDKALADYQFLVSLKNLEDRIQRKSPEEQKNFKALNRERAIVTATASQAEIFLADVIQEHRLPKLEDELRKGNFGIFKGNDYSKFEEQSTGALKITYMILMREFGVNADLNNDGEVLEGEEQLIPCETLEQIEKLWRKFTENRCGLYGMNNINCHEFYESSIITNLIIPSSWAVVEDRITNQCKLISLSTKEIGNE
ncbi:hypothetical protein VB714_11140, partial [Spirulina sp. 06S082]